MIVQHGRIPWQILTDIRTAAVEYATHGWPIQPGTYKLTGSPRWHGRQGAIGLLPVHDDWPIADRTDPDLALNLWTIRPYSILIACGTVFDAVEVPAAFGHELTELLRADDCLPPMITTSSDTWILLTSKAGSHAVSTDYGILTHTTGSLLALPSAPDAHLGHRWRIHPRSVGWAIPDASQVLQAIDKATHLGSVRGDRCRLEVLMGHATGSPLGHIQTVGPKPGTEARARKKSGAHDA